MKNAGKILKAIMVKLGMEVKLEQMKLADGVTIIEADAFEQGMDIFIVTEDEQKIPLPIGDYELEDGRVLSVKQEGIIDMIGEAKAEEEAPATEEVEADSQAPATVESSQPKVITESTIKEYKFGAEMPQEVIEAIERVVEAKWNELNTKVEMAEVTPETIELEEEPKPIAFNPENEQKVDSFRIAPNRGSNTMDRVLKIINGK